MNRYEYYDGYGNLIGYKKWNSIMNQYEYYDTRSNRTNKKREYVKPYDFNLINNALANKQRNFDSNVSRIQAKILRIDKMFSLFYDYIENPSVKKRENDVKKLQNAFIKGIQKINNSRLDYGRSSVTRKIIDWLEQFDDRMTSIFRKIQQDIK